MVTNLLHIKIDGIWYWQCNICGRNLAPHKEKWQYLQSKGAASRHLMTHDKNLVQHGRVIDDILITNRFLTLTQKEIEILLSKEVVSITVNKYLYPRYILRKKNGETVGKVEVRMDLTKFSTDTPAFPPHNLPYEVKLVEREDQK